MNKKMRIAAMFFRANFKKYVSAILTLTTFLLVLNFLLGILFSTTGIFNNTIRENNSMRLMEIVNNDDLSTTVKIKEFLDGKDGLNASFIDTAHPVVIPCNNNSGMELYTLVGVPKKMLSDFHLEATGERYLFLPEKDKSFFPENKVSFQDTIFIDQPDGSREASIKQFNYDITGFFAPINWDYFPDTIAIIDSETAMEIAVGMSEDGKTITASRVIASVLDVADMQEIQTAVKEQFPNTDVRYALKYSGKLPEYATVLVAVSGIIMLILIVFCFVNIRSNVKQILTVRQRDIGLLSLFGVRSKDILSIFVGEFLLNGVITFVLSTIVTILLFTFLLLAFSIDLLSNYIFIYLVSNAIIAVIMFAIISSLQVGKTLKEINNAKIFKDILK